MTEDVFNWFPRFKVLAFTEFSDFAEALTRETGEKFVDDEGEGLCVTVVDGQSSNITSFILLRQFDRDDDQCIALLANEASRAVDDFLSRVEEGEPGGEIKGRLLQAAVLSCLKQLG